MSTTLRTAAYEALGITPEAVLLAPKITPQLKAIAGVLSRAGQPKVTLRQVGTVIDIEQKTEHKPPYGPGTDLTRSWPWYLQTCDAPDANKILVCFLSIPKTLRKLLPIEAFCVAAGVPPLRALELITGAVVRLGAQASTIIAAVNHPRVVEKTVEMALTDGGIEDRNTLHKAVGFLPTPKSATTTIQVNANATSTAQSASAVPAPPPEATIRRMVNRFNETRGALPADTGSIRIPDVMPHTDAEEAELIIPPDEEEEEAMQAP